MTDAEPVGEFRELALPPELQNRLAALGPIGERSKSAVLSGVAALSSANGAPSTWSFLQSTVSKETICAALENVGGEVMRDMRLSEVLPDGALGVCNRDLDGALELELRRIEQKRDGLAITFNQDPKLALAYFMGDGKGTGLLRDCNPEDVAIFILTTPTLSKRRIGEFFGRHAAFNQEVLREYLIRLNFQAMSLDEALRILLKHFRLPGEAQQIDRILEKFASVYYGQNPDVFASADAAFVLSFSMIMLNTDLHNRNIAESKKMTLRQFISNNRGINGGASLPDDLLKGYYNRIKGNEIRMHEEDQFESEAAPFVGAVKAGWLNKMGEGVVRSWHKHWFVLANSCLYYFSGPTETESTPRCTIPIEDLKIGRGLNRRDIVLVPLLGDIIKTTKYKGNKSLPGRHRQFQLRAKNEKDREEWVKALQRQNRMTSQRALDVRNHPFKGLLPSPVKEGWVRKRGLTNSSWKPRYCALFDLPNGMSTIFYFTNRFAAQRMMDLGEMTHQGFILMGEVQGLETRTGKDGISVIQMKTANRTWFLSPEGEDFQLWLSLLWDRVSIPDAIRRRSIAQEAAAVGQERLSSASRNSGQEVKDDAASASQQPAQEKKSPRRADPVITKIQETKVE